MPFPTANLHNLLTPDQNFVMLGRVASQLSVLLIAVLVAACSTSAQQPSSAGDKTTPTPALTSPPASTPPVALPPPCKAPELRASIGGDESSIGFVGFDVALRSVATRPCSMAARVRSIAADGVVLPMTPVVSDHGGPQVLPPQGAALFHIGSERGSPGSDPCKRTQPPTARHPHALRIGLPQGGALRVQMPTTRPYALDCIPLVVSRLYRA